MNLNKVFLIGRLTQDPQMRATPSGQNVCSFGLATNKIGKDPKTGETKKSTEFHNIVLWGKLAEIASQYLKKGSLALIEGRLQTRNWQDNQGNQKYKTEVIGQGIQLGPRSDQGSNFSQQERQASPQAGKDNPADEDIPVIEEEDEIDVKNIPL